MHSALGASHNTGADEMAAILQELQEAVKAESWDDGAAAQAQLAPAFIRVEEA